MYYNINDRIQRLEKYPSTKAVLRTGKDLIFVGDLRRS